MSRRRKSRKSAPFPFKTVLYIVCALIVVVGWFGFNDSKASVPAASSNNNMSDESTSAQELCKVIVPSNTIEKIIYYPGFTVSFNKEHHQPNWVSWELTRDETKGTLSRSNNFAVDSDVEGCALLEDYKNSGYDRGHMAPAADMKWSEDAMNACFYLTNMSPQASALNSGSWKNLEDKCREWASRDSAIIIICGPILTDRITKTIGISNVSVPTRYFKVILAPYANPPRAIGFIMNNGKVAGGMQQAAMSVDEVESITGFDFFSSLPDDIENEVEAQNNFTLWSRLKY